MTSGATMKRFLVIPAFLALAACHPQAPAAKTQVTVAAAANLTDVFSQIGPAFETQTGIHPVFSFASTAQLTRQVENGAPFDLIAAADSEHITELGNKGFLTPGTSVVYARGVLALWIPPGSKAKIESIPDLAHPDVHMIAIAKPELAPYGQASVDTLEKLGIWNQVQSKIVYAENISMAREYGQSRNADAVFTAYSLLLQVNGKVIKVDESLHKPLDQELGVVAKSSRQDAAQQFANFITAGQGQTILAGFGYLPPTESPVR